MIATGTALAIGALTAAGSTVAGAKMGANASNNAAKTQAAAADKALAFEQGVYNRDVSDYDKGLGSLAAGNTVMLGDLMKSRRAPATAESIYGAGQIPGAMTIGQMRQAGSGQTPAAAGMVQMRAPDGEVRMVRPESVAKYEARGAVRV